MVSCHRHGRAHGFVGKGRQSWLPTQRAAGTLRFQNSTLIKQNLFFFFHVLESFGFFFWSSCLWGWFVSKHFRSGRRTRIARRWKQNAILSPGRCTRWVRAQAVGQSTSSGAARASGHAFRGHNAVTQLREAPGLNYQDMKLARKPLLFNADTQCLERL